jgi:uncharacterized protein YhaN
VRIENVDLRAFGPFTGKTLDFSSRETGLHVIYGLNEAGKSSALRALTAALFGIHARTPENFVHDYTALRLAMTLQSAKGARISFVRRKATKEPLRDAGDFDALPDDALRPFLGGVDDEEFHRVFGLDHVRLRQGSERLLDAAEGADAAIVGAALGVNHLREVRKGISEEAADIFAARSRKAEVSVAISEWKQLHKELREHSLSVSAWNAARLDAERLATARDEAVADQKGLRSRLDDLVFVRRNRPRVLRLVDLRVKLAALAAIPDLDAGFDARRIEAETQLRTERVKLLECGKDEEQSPDLGSLPSDFVFLEHEKDVDDLRELSSQAAKGTDDRERLRAKAQTEADECTRRAGELGLPVPLDVGTIEDLRLALGAQERCQDLLQEHTRITTSQKEIVRRIRKLELKLEECEGRLASRSNAVDSGPLDRAVANVMKMGDPDADLERFRTELEEQDLTITAALARLPGYDGDAADLATRPVPGPESLDEFQSRFREVEDEERQARQRGEELREQRNRFDEEIDRLLAEQAVPSEEDLTETRSGRQARWRLVRRAWIERADVDAEASELDPDRPLADSFERAIERSDDLVDRIRRESDRVATLAGLRRQREQKDRELAELERSEQDRQGRREQLDSEWCTAWDGSGLEVRDWSTMKDTLAVRQQLLGFASERRGTNAMVEKLEAKIATARSALEQALAATGASASDASSDGSLASILRFAEGRRAVLVKALEEHSKDKASRDDLGGELREEQSDRKALDKEIAEWTEAFAVATRGLPVREEDPPDTVQSLLRQVVAVLGHSDEERALRDRIEKIDGDNEELTRRLGEFRATHAPDLPDSDPAACIAQLVSRVEAKKRERQAFEHASQRAQEAERKRKGVEGDVEIAKQTLADLASEAGAASVDELPDLVRRAADKRSLGGDLATIESDLLGEGFAIEEIERRVAALDGIDIDAELAPLESELARSSDSAEAKRQEASEKQFAFEAMVRETGAGGAAEIAEQAASVEARLRDAAERYVRLTLASQLLGTAVEQFRQSNEAPMLKFASTHLEGLTQGRYTRVETDLNEKDLPYFLVRETGASAAKTVQDLSDGTRDQLQLALVLGSLEHRFAAGAEPMPLVLDDVLVHFDDRRSMAALEVLAKFAHTGQVLLFTHHEKIRDLALSLGPDHGVAVCEI